MTPTCPHCGKSLGGLNKAGEIRIRLPIVLCDPSSGRVHGPCPKCKGDVTLSAGGSLSKAITRRSRGLGIPVVESS